MTHNRISKMKKTHYYHNTYRNDLLGKIESLPNQVFSRNDLTINHSNQEQLRLNRALKAFIEEGHIIKIAHGLYAKAEKMAFPNNEEKPVLRKPFEDIAIEALNKLGIKWQFGTAIQEYNRGESNQVPVNLTIRLKSRFRGTISAEGRKIFFEGDINAR